MTQAEQSERISPTEVRLPLMLRGGNLALYNAREPEIPAEGPAGTGKTRTALELLNELAATFNGLQLGIVRKVHRTMAGSCLREFNQHVLHPGEGVAYHGGSGNKPEGYYYPNGSVIMVLGMDDRTRYCRSSSTWCTSTRRPSSAWTSGRC